jgi:hypothetical protein
MHNLSTVINQNNVRTEFTAECGGFPSRIVLLEDTGAETVLMKNNNAQMRITLTDGRSLIPCFTPECTLSHYNTNEGAERVEFRRLLWTDASGKTIENFIMSIRYEFWPDGTTFVKAFFMAEDNNPPAIQGFELAMPVETSAFDNVRWGFFPRPAAEVDGAFIQTIATARFIESGNNKSFDGTIIPNINFNCFRKKSPGVYAEFFMEGQNSLSGKPDDNSTTVTWNNQEQAVINWNFQKTHCQNRQRPWQWQNQWGWLITPAPTSRRFPPLRAYHYFDNYKRYPDAKQISKMAEAGADLLILHENWRLDAQNDGVPYNSEKFNTVVKEAKKHHMRMAVYIRGNELSGKEEACDWFDGILEKDRDGLYMDYGGPIHETEPPDERFQGGRIAFRRHFLKIRSYRQRVGKRGILLSHTGPFFSALGMTGGNVDCYVSGEGERGVLIKGRMEHEYFSEAFVSPGSMWTAAFPEYGTSVMVPFLATAGQLPHCPLGTQFKSSSLSHYGEPGINDRYLRPLWKLWGLFKDECDITCFNDYNCYGVLTHDSQETGGNLMISHDKKTALLIISNFYTKTRDVKTEVDWSLTGFDPDKTTIWQCCPTMESPHLPELYPNSRIFETELAGHGVAGWLLSVDSCRAENALKFYKTPYPKLDEADIEHLQLVEAQKKLRNEPIPSSELFLKVTIPELSTPYEDSLYWDLYDNKLELGVFDHDGSFQRLGWISKCGFEKAEPTTKAYIWPGQVSPWIPLHDLLQKGEHNMGIRSIHSDSPFYSFITITLSSRKDDESAQADTLFFMNELEPHREFITWKITLKD